MQQEAREEEAQIERVLPAEAVGVWERKKAERWKQSCWSADYCDHSGTPYERRLPRDQNVSQHLKISDEKQITLPSKLIGS
jgi:hypothetical protein